MLESKVKPLTHLLETILILKPHFRLRQDFKKMLEDMGCVTPGKALGELKVLFLGRECFENLPEAEILEIYDLHQRELIARSKKNFQELLLERSDLFYQYRDDILLTRYYFEIFQSIFNSKFHKNSHGAYFIHK